MALLVPLILGLLLVSTRQIPAVPLLLTTPQAVHKSPAQQEAIKELNQAARAYREGNLAEAQQHSEKALALDPSSRVAPQFIARCIHAQYRPGDGSEENLARAREAIEAYKRILDTDPQHEESYQAVAFLLGELKEEQLQREWILRRAYDPGSSSEKRAEAFVVLASRAWDCSFKITESPVTKTAIASKRGSPKIRYVKPKDLAQFEKANRCAANGLEMIDMAVMLDPESEMAWPYKAQLLIELSKLADMDNNRRLKAEYDKQAERAQATAAELVDRKGAGSPNKP